MRLLACAVLAIALGSTAAAVVLLRVGSNGHAAAGSGKPAAPGCSLVNSPYGYPASYLTQFLPYKVHPPLPTSGWHDQHRPLQFDVLFHSLFHGYLVITYRSDVPESSRSTLRAWVTSHSRDRVVASPTPLAGTPRIDVAEWNWELRCDTTTPTAAQLDRFAARRTT
jgi:hypothetical protein